MKQGLKYTASLVLLFSSIAIAADFEVVGLAGNGEITWDDVNTNGTYTVQWSSSLQTNWSSDWSSLTKIAAAGGIMKAQIPMYFRIIHSPGPTPAAEMMLVSRGGQPQGPQYDFYMSKYEVRNEQFCDFLNDAQANPATERGAFMYFSANGNVYINSIDDRWVMFRISDSRLLYNPDELIGSRYSVYNDYLGHPITGVSWYGAVKYCNWLTIHEGRGLAQRCYQEGSTHTNWYPAHLTYPKMEDGFSDVERQQWIGNYAGFRLPMDHNSAEANYYNEFYKAAAWTGTSNSLYAHGRGTISGQDANYINSGDPYGAFVIKTTPVGYYDGSSHGGTFQTQSNANHWEIYDLSGNVYEWMTDAIHQTWNDSPNCRGGGWNSASSSCRSIDNTSLGTQFTYSTWSHVGFRVVSTSP